MSQDESMYNTEFMRAMLLISIHCMLHETICVASILNDKCSSKYPWPGGVWCFLREELLVNDFNDCSQDQLT